VPALAPVELPSSAAAAAADGKGDCVSSASWLPKQQPVILNALVSE
jgi:hypothetical protein